MEIISHFKIDRRRCFMAPSSLAGSLLLNDVLIKQTLRQGRLVGAWSGAICMLMTITLGFSQLLTAMDRIEAHDAGRPTWLRK
jgi:hypothetical protein